MPILYLINAESFFMTPFVQPDEVMIVRYVQPLTPEQRQLLETTMKDASSFRARSRAHGLLLSAAGTPIKAIAKTYQVHRVTVSAWIKHWEQHGAQSLHDKPRSGRPRTLRPEERDIAHSTQFSGGVGHCSSKASRREDLEIEQPVACWDRSSFHFHPTLASMLGATLIRYQVVEVR